jgi:hypothetical protein
MAIAIVVTILVTMGVTMGVTVVVTMGVNRGLDNLLDSLLVVAPPHTTPLMLTRALTIAKLGGHIPYNLRYNL